LKIATLELAVEQPVYTVDSNGNATSFAVTPTGQSYDAERDDWLVGIINNSTGALKAIALSTPASSTEGVFAFDGDGPCIYNRSDCYGSILSTGWTYRGPNNTFVTSGNGRTGTVKFTNPILPFSSTVPQPPGTCGTQLCNSTWFALESLPVTNVAQQVNPVSTSGPSTVTNTFNNSVTVIQEIDFPGNTANPNGSDSLATTNFPIDSSVWPQYVVGTPWATSQCAAHLGNGGSGNLCSLYVNACWNSATQSLSTASDAFCPSVNNPSLGVITLKDTFDWIKPQILPGTTVSLIAFTPPASTPYLQWTSSNASVNPVCANILSTATPCYITDRLVDMYGDQTTTRGTSPRTKSWNITAFNVAMLLTNVLALPNSSSAIPPGTVACPLTNSAPLNDTNPGSSTFENPPYTTTQNLWFNGNCYVDFVVNKAIAPPVPNNNFVAAIPSTFTYGSATVPDPSTPLSNTGSAAPWDTQSQLQGLTLTGLLGGDGSAKSMHWSAMDAAGITEKNIQLLTDPNATCPNPDNDPSIPPHPTSTLFCYTTSLFSTQVNLDSVSPSLVQACAQTPASANGYGWYNTDVTANCSAADDRSGIGSASPAIAGVSPATPVLPPTAVSFAVGTNVPTSNASAYTGNQSVCDLAGNCLNTQLGPFQIDKVAPTVGAITFSPAGPTFLRGQSVTASFSCSDAGSGIATCNGPNGTQSPAAVNTATSGAQTFTVTATDKAGNSANGSANYTVGDFTINVTPASQTISSGHTGTFTITVTPGAGLTGTVNLSCTNPIPSTTCTISPNVDNLSGSPINSTVTLNASKSVTHGTWTLTFTGTYAGTNVTRTTTSVLTIKGQN